MNSKAIEYTNGAIKFIGQLYWDDSHHEKRPSIVVFPEAYGLGDHARQRAQQLAQLGYVVLAADPHGEGKYFDDLPSVGPAIKALYSDRSEWRSRARAALDTLIAQPLVDANKIGAVGFCFGGTTCLELARSGAPLKAIATFHAGLVPELPQDAGQIHAKVLVLHGADDPLLKKEVIDIVMNEFRRDKVDWQFNYYGNTAHSFTNDSWKNSTTPGFAYNEIVTARSWATMRNLFDEVFN